jgi:hypothetical protein
MIGGIEKAPGKPEEYKFTPMANLHADLKADSILAQLRPLLHAAGAGNKLADTVQQGLLTQISNIMTKRDEEKKALSLANETALRAEWKGDYDAKFDKIVKTLALVGGPDLAQAPDALIAAMKGSPAYLKGMGKLIGLLSEDSLKSLGAVSDGVPPDAAAAQGLIDAYNAEISAKGTSHPYFNVKDAGHNEAVQKMHDLFALKNKAK